MDTRKDIQNRNVFLSTRTAESASVVIGKKCDRLATALYLVTSFLSDTEPMKVRLRTLSLELVARATGVRYGSTRDTEVHVLDDIRANIAETLSLLEVAFVAGIVSEMNFSILKREYSTLRDKIDIKKASRESRTDTVLGESFFGTSFTEEGEVPSKTIQHTEKIPERDKSTTDVAPSYKGHVEVRKQEGLKVVPLVTSKTDDVSVSTEQKVFHIPNKEQVQSIDIARESRRARVLKLIKDKREVTIKDISNHFPELSEKTIQRELISLVETGVLKKAGERRWSRYSIA